MPPPQGPPNSDKDGPMTLLLLACLPPAVDSNPRDTADTQAQEPPFACPSWLGFDPGAVRSFQSIAGLDYDYAYTATVEPKTVSAEHNTRVAVTQVSQQTGGGWSAYSATETLHYRCDATGAWYEGLRRDWSGTAEGSDTPQSGWLEATFENYLYFPMDPSAPWTADWTGTFADHSGNKVDDARTYTYTPLGQESVTVPAGTFQALKVERDAGGTPSLEWYAESEGLVQTETLERVP